MSLNLDPTAGQKKTKKNTFFQVAAIHAAALEQDANAFDYDGVYDEMKAGGGGEKGKKKSLVGGSGSKVDEEATRR